jgi:muconate cycloisomerase
MGVDLIEQPVSAHDNAALVRLSQHIETAILADEAVAAYDGYQLAQQGFTGAYAENRQSRRTEQRAGAGASPRRRVLACMAAPCWRTVRTVASLHAWSTLPLQWGHRNVRPAVAERRYRQRAAHLADGRWCSANPGLGVELDEDKLRFYTRQA